MKDTQGRCRREAIRTSRFTPPEWQTPRRTSQPELRLELFTLPLANRFSQLPEMEPVGEVHPDIGGEPTTPPHKNPQPKKSRKPQAKQARPSPAKTERAGGVRVQPHGDSYFLPEKVAGKPVTFLLDSGCTTNLLSRRVFDALPPKGREN